MLVEATAQGRRFRPLLLLITNKGVGGQWRDAIDLACAIELLHKASLIHDDVIDNDNFRRGKPTFWRIYGKRQAIIVGDLLIGLLFTTVSRWCNQNESQHANNIFEIFTSTLNETAIGEIFDVYFESVPNLDCPEIEQMISLKSGSLISACMRIGAISGGASADIVETVTCFGRCIGIIFQMINDMNSITGRDRNSKGSYHNDAIQKKKTFSTFILQQAGISIEELSVIPKYHLMEVLKPVKSEIDRRIIQASHHVKNLPDGFMKKLFFKLLKEAHSDWFWINIDN